ncbi:O-antigen ligase family protein [bacterium]|nr:O-antigen ligase family protein [bacterium]
MIFQKQYLNRLIDTALQISLFIYLIIIPIEFNSAGLLYTSLGAAVVLLLLKFKLNPGISIDPTAMTLPFVLLFLWSLTTVLWSILPGITFKFARREILVYLIIYFVVRHVINTESKIKLTMTVFFSSALFVQVYGVFAFFMGYAIFNGRLIGTFFHPNVFGLFAAATISFSMAYLLDFKSEAKDKILPLLVLLTGIASLIFSSSRANMMGIVIAFLVMVLIKEKKLLLIFFMLFLFIIILSPFQREDLVVFRISQLVDLFDIGKSPLGERYYLWYTAINIIKEHPLKGIGYGEVFKEEYVTRMLPQATEIQPHSHNIFLEIALETGLPGLFLFLWVHIFILKYLLKAFKNCKNAFYNKFLLGYSLFLIAFFVNGMVDFISRYRLGLLFWFFTSIMVGISRKVEEK